MNGKVLQVEGKYASLNPPWSHQNLIKERLHLMEFKALRIATLNKEVAANLENLLHDLPGVTEFTIVVETKEVSIKFDENQLSFRDLVKAMTKVGCSLQNIDAALLL